MKSKNNTFCLSCILLMSAFICLFSCKNKPKAAASCDFAQILQKDTLTVLTLNASTSYFIYRDQPMGYHYDMIRSFCNEHGLKLNIKLAKNSPELVKMLLNNEGDVIACDVPRIKRLKDSIIYCGLSQVSHQVLVQRSQKKDTLLRDVTQLIGKEVYVKLHTKYYDRMVNLNKELGGGIIIKDIDKDTVVEEDMIRMVSLGELKYTIADEYIAKLNQTYFRNINISVPVSFDQRSSWAVRKNAPILADSLNAWFERVNTAPAYLRITKRYFEEAKGYSPQKRFLHAPMIGPKQISIFDVYFKKYGEQFGIDWRLIAAVAYQESTFENHGTSWAGAVGIMGLMPSTAALFGVKDDSIYNPEMNIKAGAQYLKRLLQAFSSVKDITERTKMALAAYNGGIGHIYDARALAEKYGANPQVWDGNVEKYLHLKRVQQYYEDPVSKAGYFRGDETLRYVPEVMGRWQLYKRKIK